MTEFEYKMNVAQRKAIEYIDGPLLIVAGAGTGKTTVITNKIAYLIEKGLAKPEEILALAFNEKAAQEIQDRVDKLVNTSYSEITISTFHGFCQRILERHGIDIGLSNQFTLLNSTASWLMVRENLEKFNLDYYKPAGNPTKHIHEMLKHFSKCKDELISPADYLAYAENVSADSDNTLLEDKSRLTEIANAYHIYNQLLLDSAKFDFGDLLYYPNILFSKRPEILKKFQNRYKYILVDEFQDVNWAQYNLVRLLSSGGAQLTVVGDDDQSIYAFRGASVSNIMRFKDDFKNASEIVLNENYRSAQTILDTAYKSIQNNNPDRLEVKLNIDKKLISKAKEKKGSVVHIHSDTIESEARGVVAEILRLREIDSEATWDDFAILVRANSHADAFIAALEEKHIPYEFLAASGLFRQPIVVDCLSFFSALTDHTNSNAIFRLLRMPFLKFSENDLQRFTKSAKVKATSYFDALKKASEFGLSQGSVAAAEKIHNFILNGLKLSRETKPTAILYNFLDTSGYLEYLKTEEEAGNRDVIRQSYQLKEFFDYLENYERITPDSHVVNFMSEFETLEEAGERGILNNFSDTPDSVNIMTVHKSKGLEYKYVFVVNMVEDRFPSRTKGDGIEIPLALIKEQLPEGDSHYEEERRLFYVAVTRAKKNLYFTSASNYGGVRAKKISRFLAELDYSAKDDANTIPKIAEKHLPIEKKRQQIIYELPKTFSFSHIQTYETCPYKYKLQHVLSLPTRGSHYFSFGTTIHSTLQEFYGRVKTLNEVKQESLFSKPTKKATGVVVPELEELFKIYESKWVDEWYQSGTQKKEYKEKGKKLLKTFYDANSANWTIPHDLESFFKIKIGDYTLNGRIDRVDILPDGGLEIIDYKTGKAKKTLASNDKEQLLIYQIAAEELSEFRNIAPPKKLTYYYLEENIKQSFIGEPADTQKVKENIKEVIDNIKDQKFDATPNQFACEHCEFRNICEFRV